jgi:hypothetical protein
MRLGSVNTRMLWTVPTTAQEPSSFATVAEIRRVHFPNQMQFITELLVIHAKLSALRVQIQLKLSRSGRPAEPMLSSVPYLGLLRVQTDGIEALRKACCTERR